MCILLSGSYYAGIMLPVMLIGENLTNSYSVNVIMWFKESFPLLEVHTNIMIVSLLVSSRIQYCDNGNFKISLYFMIISLCNYNVFIMMKIKVLARYTIMITIVSMCKD